jgi:hypothetical protein
MRSPSGGELGLSVTFASRELRFHSVFISGELFGHRGTVKQMFKACLNLYRDILNCGLAELPHDW